MRPRASRSRQAQMLQNGFLTRRLPKAWPPTRFAAAWTATAATTLPVGYAVTTTGPAPSEAAPPPPPSMTPLVEAARRRRKQNDVTLIASGLLAVASIVLVIVLVLVWRAQTRENAAETEQPGPASEASTL